MQRHNVERVVVSIANQDIARRQIEAIHRAMPNVEIQTYRYYYWTQQAWARVDDEHFIADLRRNLYNVQFHWIDIEDNGVIQPVAANIADTNDLINFWAGKSRTGIYTAKWIWDILFKDYDGFNFMPLWYADWDWQEKLELDVPFGGWTTGAMRQTMGDFSLDGVLHCDTNHYEKEIIVTPPPPPPPVPPKYNVSVVYSEGVDNKTVTLVLPKDAKVEASGFGDK
jgi:hypothetical protein